jgi:tRNA threonylcarbamoyladenosine biosynthesis protein TsaE
MEPDRGFFPLAADRTDDDACVMPAAVSSMPLPDIVLPDERASDRLGEALADVVIGGITGPLPSSFDGFTIHFSGALGVGKTTIVRALLRRLGVEGRIKSPTYTLVEAYVVEIPIIQPKSLETRQNVKLDCYHFDFYRFEDPHEWLDAGFRDAFADAALRLVEWPERAVGDEGSLLPAPDLSVGLEASDPGRVAHIGAATERGVAWLMRSNFASALQPGGDASSKAG